MIARLLVAASLAALVAPVAATPHDLRTVAGMRNHERVLLAFAPGLRDDRLREQQRAMARFAAGAATRDLSFVQVGDGKVIGAADDARKLRRAFKIGAADFRVLLIGKDGNVALSETRPLPEARIAAAIDALPMRQAEIARARAGLGKAGN